MSAVSHQSEPGSPRLFFFHEDTDITFKLGKCEDGQVIVLKNIRGSGVVIRARKPGLIEHIKHWVKRRRVLRYRLEGVDPDPYQVRVTGFHLDVTLPHQGCAMLVHVSGEWLLT